MTLVVGFSDWSEWSQCSGNCRGYGRQTRSRTCEGPIENNLSCVGPTKEVRNCELNCADTRQASCNPNSFPKDVQARGCSYDFHGPKNWNAAQETCKANGGKLWEPASETEYEDVVTAAEAKANGYLGNCRWWLGLFNWNDGSPNSVDAYLSSTVTSPPTTGPLHSEPTPINGVISSFIKVYDGNDGGSQNCVHTQSGWNHWYDRHCDVNNDFICQKCPPPCTCSFNNILYPCGSKIKISPHCCTTMVCNKEGVIEEQAIRDSNGKPESGCCLWRGRLYRDGDEFGPFWFRHVCCRGKVLFKRFWWGPHLFPVKPSNHTSFPSPMFVLPFSW